MKKDSLLPIYESDKADDIIKKDKKDLTILLIVGLVGISVSILTAFIALAVCNLVGFAFLALFLGALIIPCFIIAVMNAHNASRRTVALMKLSEVVTGEEPISDELLIQVLNNRKTDKYIEAPDSSKPADADKKNEIKK